MLRYGVMIWNRFSVSQLPTATLYQRWVSHRAEALMAILELQSPRERRSQTHTKKPHLAQVNLHVIASLLKLNIMSRRDLMRVVFGWGQSVSDESLHLLKWDFTVNPPFSYLTEPIIGHVSGNLTWCIYLPIHRRESSITSLIPQMRRHIHTSQSECLYESGGGGRGGGGVCGCLCSAVGFVYLWPLQCWWSGCVIWAGGDHGYWLTFGTVPRWAGVNFE